MQALTNLVETYGRTEKALQRCMLSCCDTYCAKCKSMCCRVHFCRETLESPFLKLVRHRFAPSSHWDPSVGWLTSGGCSLRAGRPPVCYEFICRVITEGQPSSVHLEALKRLAMLMTEAGRRARGKKHLVELGDLKQLNRSRLMIQVEHVRSVLIELKDLWPEPQNFPLSSAA